MPSFLRPLTRNMLDLDAPDHPRLRALVQKAFTPQRVETLRPRVEMLVDDMLLRAQRTGAMDVVADLALPLPLTVIAELLGVPKADQPRFHRWTTRIVSASTAFDAVLLTPAVAALFRYLRRLFAQRRIDPRDDLITALVQAEEAGDRLTESELVGMVFLLLAAGHETTVNLISGAVHALLQDTGACEELRAQLRVDAGRIGIAVEELLRFTSPVDVATERYAGEPLTLCGIEIAAGEMVLGLLGSANYDPLLFAQANSLNLTREPNRHLAFGLGGHYCLGAPLARLETQIALTALLTRAPRLRLGVAPDALRWRRNVFLRGLEALPVVL